MIKGTYISQINNLENEVKILKTTNKHITNSPMDGITSTDYTHLQELRQVNNSNNAKIRYLTTENEKLQKEKIDHQKLHELMNDTKNKIFSPRNFYSLFRNFYLATIKLSALV